MAVFKDAPSSSANTVSALSAGAIATQSIWMQTYPGGYLTFQLIVTPGQAWPATLPAEGTAGNNPTPTQPTIDQPDIQIGAVEVKDATSANRATVSSGGALLTSDTTTGATTDTAVVTDVNGSVSGKLRGLVKIFADVWNSTTHRLQVTPGDGTSEISVSTVGADAFSNTANRVRVSDNLNGFNGTTWDRVRAGITGVVSTVTGYLNVIPVGKYNASAPVLTDGQLINPQLDSSGNLKVTQATLSSGEDQTNNVLGVISKPVNSSSYAPLTYQQAGSVTKAVVKAGTGNVYSIRVTNANAAVRYFQLHNKTTAPAGTDTAQLYFLVPAGTATAPGVLVLDMEFFAPSEYFSTGIGWAISTTSTAFTDSATAADTTTTIRYI
jgi:hypothetical protein